MTIASRPSCRVGRADHTPDLVSEKQKYFLFWGLTRFLKIGSDLPVVSFCRSRDRYFACAESAAAARPRTGFQYWRDRLRRGSDFAAALAGYGLTTHWAERPEADAAHWAIDV